MNSRMERYNSKDINEESESSRSTNSRVLKNNSLYQDIKTNELSRVRSNDNIKVIENSGKTIDLEKIRKYITEINEQPSRARKGFNIDVNKQKEEEKAEEVSAPKDYDLNSVLEKAKKTREIDYDRERYKKLRDTQYDILSKIDMYDSKEEELVNDLTEDFNTDERTLIDLINTVTIHKGEVNLLEELMGEEGEETTEPIEKEVEKGEMKSELLREETLSETIEKPIITNVTNNIKPSKPELAQLKDKTMQIDNSFYTNSMSFSKDDFEGFDELEKSVKKNGVMSTVLIIILVIFIAITLVIMANYVFDLGLF